MLRNSYAPGAFSRRLRWFGAFLSLCLVMSALAPTPAAAVSIFADFTVDATTVNPQTGAGHVTISMTCLVPAEAITVHLGTTQTEGQGRSAESADRAGVLTGCETGQRITIVIPFGERPVAIFGKFAPGPATIVGLVGAFGTVPNGMGFSFGPMTVLLHPEP